MSSEIIVVLVLTALAAAFIIWVRMKSEPESHDGQAGNQPQKGKSDAR